VFEKNRVERRVGSTIVGGGHLIGIRGRKKGLRRREERKGNSFQNVHHYFMPVTLVFQTILTIVLYCIDLHKTT